MCLIYYYRPVAVPFWTHSNTFLPIFACLFTFLACALPACHLHTHTSALFYCLCLPRHLHTLHSLHFALLHFVQKHLTTLALHHDFILLDSSVQPCLLALYARILVLAINERELLVYLLFYFWLGLGQAFIACAMRVARVTR